MLIAGVGILAVVYWFFFRKKKAESGYDKNVMIFGNESGYGAEELGGIESGYLVKCKKDEIEDICTSKEIKFPGTADETLVTTTYRCCVPNLSAARSTSRYGQARAESGYRTNPLKICKNSLGVVIPCKPVAPEDVISTTTQG